ncbi:ABC-2 type transport system ATP-binding protein [Vibrio xiamenensis]|uniref:ABC-2 type transport system ATP-binding protein n=1 Tax=Vibrio xiamenensis TaxID=861298 RepID=A0A1G7XJS0_9VIBR|nr:ABC transporter ATP-binding protein [Vibrio xiamenensis]SDG84356.1 ABC-2 type transport system ATP-binding protein [Vibrio xiamenensis]
MKPVVRVQHVSKQYSGHQAGQAHALTDVSFELGGGQVLGLLGHNGAGKSTLIKSLLGAQAYQGQIEINGCEPLSQRAKLMENLACISDVNVLPDWMSVEQLIDYIAGVHPKFQPLVAQQLLAQTDVTLGRKIGALSKGMKVQLHLAIVVATDVNVLILDEPTLGLDLVYRDTFYRHLIEWLQDGERTLLIASHEVAEIEHLLTDVLILKHGQVVWQSPIDEIQNAFFILDASDEHRQVLDQCQPLMVQPGLGSSKWLLPRACYDQVSSLGQVMNVGLTELFLALQKGVQS